MQVGEVLQRRMLPDIVRSVCEKHGIGYQLFSDDWFMRLQYGSRTAWVCGYKFDLNGSGAGAVAQDKVATYLALRHAGIAAVPHVLARTYGMPAPSVNELDTALRHAGRVVIKPLSGTGAHGIELCRDVQEAVEKITANPEPAWAISPYLELASETRLVMLDGDVLLAYEKCSPAVQGGLKLFNLGRGAIPVNIEPAQDLCGLAISACKALSLRLAAADIVKTANGKAMVLEINDGLMMEHYTQYSQRNAREAERVYEAVILQMMASDK